MPEKTKAKVDYLKPLEDKPYAEIVADKQRFHQQVLERLSTIVGKDRVSDNKTILKKYERDGSLESPARPSFVVYPANTEQLCSLVRYANEVKCPIIPVSSGTHSYGCTIPRMGGIIVELSGWKRIHKIDYRNRAVRIEPGVTYGQLQDELEKEGLRALTPLLPRQDQSVLTAHLEAHPMLIPEFNYSEPLYTAEIVMPTGTIFRTGAAAPAPPETTNTDLIGPWGPGFDWNRLYTRAQGTLGIITWANIMAEPLPSAQKLYFTPFESIEALVSFTYRLQRKWIGYECFALNRPALASILAETIPEGYYKLKGLLPAYVHVFCIAGLKRFPEERIAYQEADFLEVAQECRVNPHTTLKKIPQVSSFFTRYLHRPWEGEIYWKEKYKGASADIFFITTLERTSTFITAMATIAQQYQYPFDDISIYLQPIENGRAAHLEFIIPYNPEDNHERTQVRTLHLAASERMYQWGALFTRAYGRWAEMVYSRNSIHYQTAKLIKETLDPNNIMNPGKLGF